MRIQVAVKLSDIDEFLGFLKKRNVKILEVVKTITEDDILGLDESETRALIFSFASKKERIEKDFGAWNNALCYVSLDTSPKSGPIPKFDKDKIFKLRKDGMSFSEIAKNVGCSKSYVQKVLEENKWI